MSATISPPTGDGSAALERLRRRSRAALGSAAIHAAGGGEPAATPPRVPSSAPGPLPAVGFSAPARCQPTLRAQRSGTQRPGSHGALSARARILRFDAPAVQMIGKKIGGPLRDGNMEVARGMAVARSATWCGRGCNRRLPFFRNTAKFCRAKCGANAATEAQKPQLRCRGSPDRTAARGRPWRHSARRAHRCRARVPGSARSVAHIGQRDAAAERVAPAPRGRRADAARRRQTPGCRPAHRRCRVVEHQRHEPARDAAVAAARAARPCRRSPACRSRRSDRARPRAANSRCRGPASRRGSTSRCAGCRSHRDRSGSGRTRRRRAAALRRRPAGASIGACSSQPSSPT